MRRTLLAITAILLAAGPLRAERIKDIVDIKGIRGNPLWGYGLVIGLNGTGDDAVPSRQAMTNILRRTGLVLNTADNASKNVASVIVQAELPPFARSGALIDVTVGAIGNSSSLQGGMLLMTELRGADGEVYSVAQGAVSIGGFSSSGQAASVTKNHPTVGYVPSGATVEREEPTTYVENGELTLQLRNPDFTTAERIVAAINELYPQSSFAPDAGNVRVQVPKNVAKADLGGMIEKIGKLDVKVDTVAMVVINERTGTIIVGENVCISTVAISHGNLSIITEEKPQVSQPAPYSKGRTETVPQTTIKATEDKGLLHVVPRQASVLELSRALNAMGLTPRDLIAIFEQLRKAGALQAQLKIM